MDQSVEPCPPSDEYVAAWQAELQKRIDETDSGKGMLSDWRDAVARIREALVRARR
jgi:hypothetical protein